MREAIPHPLLERIQEFRAQGVRFDEMGPGALQFAQKVARMAKQHPRLAQVAKRLVRWAG